MTDEQPPVVWIYHERQESALCGQHALNNLAQTNKFTTGQLATIAHQLDALELEYMANNTEGGRQSREYLERLREGSGNVDAAGNFSIQVLKAALQEEYGLTLPHLSQQDLLQNTDITDCQGFLCHKSDHWFAIREIGERFWNLDSMLEIPTAIGHFKVAMAMQNWQNEGYTIFVVKQGLPMGGKKNGTGPNWHKMSDLLRGKATGGDVWENVGSGMRLDGGGGANSGPSDAAIAGLTEEEQLQLALQQSLETPTPVARVVSHDASLLPPVPPEPNAGDKDVARISIRLPNQRCVRRFSLQDSVAVLYAYCQQHASGKTVELKYGFPPKDLAPLMQQTIGEAGLNGENLTGRYV